MLYTKDKLQDLASKIGTTSSNKLHGRNDKNNVDIIKVFNPMSSKAIGTDKKTKILDTSNYYLDLQKKTNGGKPLSFDEIEEAANNTVYKITGGSGNNWYKVNNVGSESQDAKKIRSLTIAQGLFDSYWSSDGPTLNELTEQLKSHNISKSEASNILTELYSLKGKQNSDQKILEAVNTTYDIPDAKKEEKTTPKPTYQEALNLTKNPDMAKMLSSETPASSGVTENTDSFYNITPEQAFTMYLSENPDASRDDAFEWLNRKNFYTDETKEMLSEAFINKPDSYGITENPKLTKARDEYAIATIKGDEEAASKAFAEKYKLEQEDKAFRVFVENGGNRTTSIEIARLNEINKDIEDLETELSKTKDPEERLEIEERIKILKTGRFGLVNSLRSKFEDSLNMKEQTDSLVSEYQRDFANDITFGLSGEIKNLNKVIKAAEKSGDTETLEDAKSQKKRLVGMYIGMLIHDIGATIGNIKISGAQGEPMRENLWLNDMMMKGLNSAVDRLINLKNTASDATLSFLTHNLNADQNIIANYNDLISNADTAMMSRTLNQDEKIAAAYAKEALGRHLSNIDPTYLTKAIMFSMGGNGIGPLMQVMSTLDDGSIREVVSSLTDVASSIGETAAGAAGVLNDLITQINSLLGVNGEPSLWERATNK